VAENPLECQRLVSLKEEVRRSGFPVIEGLANPQAIAERIEADLWELIERTFPEQEPPDALEKEGRRHADYRRARTGLYLGGETAIAQLEGWIAAGEQRILITGESGAGKSALIANWLEAHQRSHPQDLVHAHHLGCTNDASAVRPLLGRLIDTASQLLIQEQPISEPIKVPQDWWELVFKVGEVFALISCWIQRHGYRWILVLDGLDRLDQDDQQALPWIPTTLPPGIHIVASALDCPARSILHERAYLTLKIGPLGQGEQQQLIERYLDRYTKQLESGLQQKILTHPLAGSPLFLKVLLEELRQCAGFDTLADQLEFYLFAESIDGLYGKVLERLEKDGHGEATRQALTALWASRAGLSETELLAITGLAPVQWAPVDLALEEALGRNGERLVFGHEFVRQAVERRYLPGQAEQQEAHGALADWFMAKAEWRGQEAEELPWQLQKADRWEELRKHLMNPSFLASLQSYRGSQEVTRFWHVVRQKDGDFLDELIADAVQKEIKIRNNDIKNLIDFLDSLAAVLVDIGLQRELLLNLRSLSVEKEAASKNRDEHLMNESLALLASVHENMGHFQEAETLYNRVLESRLRLLGGEHPDTLDTVSNLGHLYATRGDYSKAEEFHNRALEARQQLLGPEHPETLDTVSNLGHLFNKIGDYDKAEAFYNQALVAEERLLGPEHPSTLITVNNLGTLYFDMGDYAKAEVLLKRAHEALERLLGPEHPSTLTTVTNIGRLYSSLGDYGKAVVFYNRALEAEERLLGPEHPSTLTTIYHFTELLSVEGRQTKAIPLRRRELAWRRQQNGDQDSSTLLSINQLAIDLRETKELQEAETLFHELVTHRQLVLEPGDFDIGRALGGLAKTLEAAGKLDEALIYAHKCLDHRLEHQGTNDFYTNRNRLDLARVLHKLGHFPEASAQLDALLASLRSLEVLDKSEQQLQKEAIELLKSITSTG
jgi:tetratricopeptide (TPR) repeat protein